MHVLQKRTKLKDDVTFSYGISFARMAGVTDSEGGTSADRKNEDSKKGRMVVAILMEISRRLHFIPLRYKTSRWPVLPEGASQPTFLFMELILHS